MLFKTTIAETMTAIRKENLRPFAVATEFGTVLISKREAIRTAQFSKLPKICGQITDSAFILEYPTL